MKKLLFLLFVIVSFSGCMVIAPRRPFHHYGMRPYMYSPRTHMSPYMKQRKIYKPYFLPGRW